MKDGDICYNCNTGVLVAGKELHMVNGCDVLADTSDENKLICKNCYWSVCQFCRKLGIDNDSCMGCNREYCPICAKEWFILLENKIKNKVYNFDITSVPFRESRYTLYPSKYYMYGDTNLCIDCGESTWKKFEENKIFLYEKDKKN